MNPHETFAGVDVPPRKGKRKRAREEDEDEDEDEDADAEQERAREGEGERNGGASSRAIVHSVNGSEEPGGAARGWGTRGISTGTGTGTAPSTTGSVTRRMEAVVVSSSKTLKAKTTSGHLRKKIVMSDDEIEFWG